MLAVFKRDFRSYFTSPLGYVYIAATLVVMNAYFYINNIVGTSTDLSPVFDFFSFILVFVVPLLTMRLFSEEFKQKTDQLLLTSPTSVFRIVAGKFLAALAVFSVVIIVSLLYVVVLATYGHPNVKQILACYIAIYCLAGAFIAIGVFISSLTENQLVAAIASLASFLGLYLLETWASRVSTVWISNLFYDISIFRRFAQLGQGILQVSDLVYYLSLMVFFIFLTARSLEKKRWS